MRVIFLDERNDGNRYKCSMSFGKICVVLLKARPLQITRYSPVSCPYPTAPYKAQTGQYVNPIQHQS